VIDLMGALKRSVAQEMPLTGAMTLKEKRPRPQPIGANERCFYPWPRRQTEEGGARDRSGGWRCEVAK